MNERSVDSTSDIHYEFGINKEKKKKILEYGDESKYLKVLQR